MTPTLLAMLLVTGTPGPAPLPDPPGELEATPWDPLVVEDCRAQLEAHGVSDFSFLHSVKPQRLPSKEHGDMYCYVPQAVHYRRGPGDIKYSSYLMFSCRMAIAMAKFEKIAQQTTEEVFGKGKRIKSIRVLGAYNCRRLRKKPKSQSQHSFGNALDVHSFNITGVGTIELARHWWDRRTKWSRRAGRYLYVLVNKLRREGIFTNLLTPNFDAGHENHFHMDCGLDKHDHDAPFKAPAAPDGGPRTIKEPEWDLPSAPPLQNNESELEPSLKL